jgi:hypothetical protein
MKPAGRSPHGGSELGHNQSWKFAGREENRQNSNSFMKLETNSLPQRKN